MRFLVTGGAGFLGSHLCERLLDRGDEVVALDDFSTGRPENLAAALARPGFGLERADVQSDALARLVGGADLVFHLAAVVGVRRVIGDPRGTWDTNVGGTRAVLAAAAAHGVPVLFASSSEVYGARSDVPFRESDALLAGTSADPRWIYARSKVRGEELARVLVRSAIVVRLFNVVGPRQVGRYGMVLPNFVAQALSGRPLTVFGSGAQTRTFLHVHDATEALLALALTPGARGGTFNVGGAEELSIAELAERVRRVIGSRSEIRRLSHAEAYGRPVDDLPRRAPDLARLRAATGFEPGRSLEQAIRELAQDLERAAALAG